MIITGLLFLLALPHLIVRSDDEKSTLLSEASGIRDGSLQNRTIGPHEDTAAEEIEIINGGIRSDADTALYLTDRLFEGCLTLDDKDRELLSRPSDSRKEDKRTYISIKRKMWPSRDIPYSLTFTGVKARNEGLFNRAIESAIRSIEAKTCIKFRKKNINDKNWIEFYTGSGCHSDLGRKYGDKKPTYISLGSGCWKREIALHMIMHALGFFHEQNRSDRDEYIRVNWGNIKEGKSRVFHRHSLYNTDMFNLKYDFNSIMHFQRNAYSRGANLYTLQARHSPNKILGNSELSELDVERLKTMFCYGHNSCSWSAWSSCSTSCGIGQRFRKEKCDGKSDIKYEMKICRLKKCAVSKFDANFEAGTGIWKVKEWYPGSCEWAIKTSKNDLKDHTTGAGSFLQADVRNSCAIGQSAYLLSDWIDKLSFKRCVNFYYVLSGEDVGDLQLYIVYKQGNHMLIWERSGSQGSEWKQGVASIPIMDEKFKLKFIFRNSGMKKSTVLLDDIYIDLGGCLEGVQRCVNMDLACEIWAGRAECFKNPVYMMRRCCRACADVVCFDQYRECKRELKRSKLPRCSVDLWSKCCSTCRDCLDWHPLCPFWAKQGECEANPSWMTVHCKTSCGVCFDTKAND